MHFVNLNGEQKMEHPTIDVRGTDQSSASRVNLNFELVVIPASDVDRAKDAALHMQRASERVPA